MVPNLGNPKVTLFGSFWGPFLDHFGDTFWTILGTTFGHIFLPSEARPKKSVSRIETLPNGSSEARPRDRLRKWYDIAVR